MQLWLWGGDEKKWGYLCHKVNKKYTISWHSQSCKFTHAQPTQAGCQTSRKWNHCQFIKLSKNVTNCIYICCSILFLSHTHTDTHVRPLRRPLCFIAKGAAWHTYIYICVCVWGESWAAEKGAGHAEQQIVAWQPFGLSPPGSHVVYLRWQRQQKQKLQLPFWSSIQNILQSLFQSVYVVNMRTHSYIENIGGIWISGGAGKMYLYEGRNTNYQSCISL